MKLSKKQLSIIIESYLNEVELPDAPGYANKGKYAYPQFQSKDEIKRFILKRMQDYGRASGADFRGQFGTQYDDYGTEEGKTIRDYRKYSKAIWNRFADHNFFKNNIAKLHQIGYAGSGNVKKSIDRRYLSSNAELSTWGIKTADALNPTPKELYDVANSHGDSMPRSNIYLVLDGRVTWAGDFDAYTEELSSHMSPEGSENDLKRKAAIEATESASGIPKRPGGVSLFNSSEDLRTFPILLDEEDVDAIPHPLIDEMIVDNWKINSVILFLDLPVVSLKNNSIEEIAKKIKLRSKKRPTNFNLLLNSSKEGFPRPRICDYQAGRYYTDAEVAELFRLIENV